jgi:signal transduction histidine kinase
MHRGEPGSGMGVYFAKRVIERQRGRTWAESDLGQGNRFVVVLGRDAAAD